MFIFTLLVPILNFSEVKKKKEKRRIIPSYSFLLQAKLTAVMETFNKVAIQKICKVFSCCFALKQTLLRDLKSYSGNAVKVKALKKKHLEKTERNGNQTVKDVPGKTSCITTEFQM